MTRSFLSFQNLNAFFGFHGATKQAVTLNKCGHKATSPLIGHSTRFHMSADSGASTTEKSDEDNIFEISTLNNIRCNKHRGRDVTKAEGIKEETVSVSELTTLSFETHTHLMDELLGMHGDPLESEGGRVVTYRGSASAKLMIIGEAPGEQEDIEGKPFVGKAGQLLDNIFRYGGFDIDRQIYVINIAKRRPADNRTPTTEEVSFYLPYVLEEIRLVSPDFVVLAGAVAMRAILGKSAKISTMRGSWFENVHGVAWTMPIFHPSFLLRKPSMKKEMVVDIHSIREKYLEVFPDEHLNDLTPVSKSPN